MNENIRDCRERRLNSKKEKTRTMYRNMMVKRHLTAVKKPKCPKIKKPRSKCLEMPIPPIARTSRYSSWREIGTSWSFCSPNREKKKKNVNFLIS